MRVLLSWLREFAPDLAGTPIEVGDQLSDLGLTCEEIIDVPAGPSGVVVARVLGLRPHPDADRIQLVEVDPGDGEPLQICCGAFNMSVGDLVPLATVGAVLPGGMEISARKLRGQWSEGMLCSSRELELGDDHAGILILPDGLEPGTPLREALALEPDVCFDLDVTPNRPDGLSVAGVARDLAARQRVEWTIPTRSFAVAEPPASELVCVEVMDPTLCGRFTTRVLSGITVGVSPAWVRRRLSLCGMRPINSIVDLSNYVMLELGQPSHTFDLGLVQGRVLGVRRARDGETIQTLDGQLRTLTGRDGVIVDGEDTAIGIAGVMGGASTEISETTTEVALELAWWDPGSIAHTSKRLGLRSEASVRFERGVDPEIARVAADRFCQLAAELGATVHADSVVVEGDLPDRSPILVRTDRVNTVLGTHMVAGEIAELLAPIGFTSVPEGGDLRVDLPTWRPDATTEIDVIEEVARHRGYGSLGRRVPRPPDPGGLTPNQQALRVLRSTLVAQGCTEVMPNPFLAPGQLERCGVRADAVRITNPLAAEESLLRTALLPGLLATLAYNAAHRSVGLSLFEIGHCYAMAEDPAALPDEWNELGVVLAGREAPAAVDLLVRLVRSIGLPEPTCTSAAIGGLHPARAAVVTVGDTPVGEVGEVDPDVVAAHRLEGRLATLRLNLDVLLALDRPVPTARPISRYPSADLDLAFVVDDAVPAHAPAATLRRADPLVTEVRLFDVFRSEQLGTNRRSLAYAVRLQSPDHTLTDEEVGKVRRVLIDAVCAAHGAELRG